MADFDLTGICACCTPSCTSLPDTLYASLSGPYCAAGCSVMTYPAAMSRSFSDQCTWLFSAGGGDPSYCPDNRGVAVSLTLTPDGTVTISSPPPSYCGPPTMTVTPTSLSPLYVTVTYAATDGNNCCSGDSGTVTLTVTE